ncbi:translation initiation factor eIF-2B subunit delta isoform X1 [Plutella xylostella]|uniref:translation initiation factor eIF-2B subunit delta isoform X1 n=1 Tax=Plutella xylostella TaxID=51655 RepID=UPI00203284E2|nr:translation initiation factor eIF-2B subunit delta isoform X1 [Plutella xylostella]
MVLNKTVQLTTAKKRRDRKKRAQISKLQEREIINIDSKSNESCLEIKQIESSNNYQKAKPVSVIPGNEINHNILSQPIENNIEDTILKPAMSSKVVTPKSREEVIAEREAKKLAKQNAKTKIDPNKTSNSPNTKTVAQKEDIPSTQKPNEVKKAADKIESPKSKDEVDKAVVLTPDVTNQATDKTKEQIKAEREAKKLAKQAKKKGIAPGGDATAVKEVTKQSVAETLTNIVDVAKEVQQVTAKVNALLLKVQTGKVEEPGKSKAELKAERRAKQEAQRAAKQAQQPAPTKPAETKTAVKPAVQANIVKEKSPKPKPLEKSKTKTQMNAMNCFEHLCAERNEESLKKIPLNSNIHPAIIKLGVQLASRVVTGSNARCIALLDALKKMVTDYSLPAKTEFARGLESHLAASLEYLWSMRQPSASQTNAVKYFRYHLTQLPNNVDEFDAKKTLHEEIDRYIREQIDMAGEAISIAVRNKISSGDHILTYGCSSLIERILVDAVTAGVQFRCVVVGGRLARAAREMLRRLLAAGVVCTYLDITALSDAMSHVNKVLLGANSLLVNGSVLGAVGTAQVALAARARNVPVLVCCETHKFSERVQTDAFVYNELGDPDALIDSTDDNSPLKDWRSNQNLNLLNLTYDVTPPSLVTAVVTELAILPCTSAPVVLRFKLSEYGI